MKDVYNDPKYNLRVKLFDAYIKKVYGICAKRLGISKYQKELPALILTYKEDELMGGYYCHDLNEMEVNYQGFDDSEYCAQYYAKLVYHEFIHYHQSPTWFKRYYNMGHDYISHPYEVEAYRREDEILKYI